MSQAHLKQQGLLGALSSMLLLPQPKVVSWCRLIWNLQLLRSGLQPTCQPHPSAPLSTCLPCWDPGGICAWTGVLLRRTPTEQELAEPCSLLTRHPHTPRMPPPAGPALAPLCGEHRGKLGRQLQPPVGGWGLLGWLCSPWRGHGSDNQGGPLCL